MKFTSTPLKGVILIEQERHSDERGFFARTFCEKELKNIGISFRIRQTNTSFNQHDRTLRGMHFQKSPKTEQKIVRCTSGKIYDVIVDLRKDSSSYCNWYGIELSQENGLSLYVPEGCAHGFLTLTPNSEVSYLMGEFYDSGHAFGVRWNDKAFSIIWPANPEVISQQDNSWPEYMS